MLIVYDSLTGNVQRFINKIQPIQATKISNDLIVDEPFILVTYTINFGEAPKKTREFLMHNHQNLKGVASSGNRNWGDSYAKAANVISEQYGVPIIHQFELSGTKKDTEIFLQEVSKIDNQYSKMD